MLAVVAAVFFMCGLPWFQGFVKTWVISNVNSKLAGIGEQVNTVQTNTADMQKQLDDHQSKINAHQKEISVHQAELNVIQTDIRAQQTTNAAQMTNIIALNDKVHNAQTNLDAQQTKLANVELVVASLYSKTQTEGLSGIDTNKVFVVNDWGNDKRIGFLLSQAAIPNSIHGFFEDSGLLKQTALHPVAFSDRNFFTMNFRNLNLSNALFTFEYVADDRETNLFNVSDIVQLVHGLQKP